jgi:asparagine synthase (glutamine-hydrolysing)
VLTGWDGDMLFADSPRHYLRKLKADRNFPRMLAVLAGYAWINRRVVPESWMNRAMRRVPVRATYDFPRWIEPGFAQRLQLQERWAELNAPAGPLHPVRPNLFRTLDRTRRLSWFFASFDPTLTGHALDYRHPFLDLRMIEFCLGLPPWPWCDRKYILRTAMRSSLPPDVLARPKTPLNGYPYMERARLGLSAFPPIEAADPRIYSYVSRASIPRGWVGRIDPLATWADLRVLSLDLWLKTSRAVPG